ncbi:PucR family transcriptional regulator ligand-binding domain-containing protein [Bengtsoniella intestinalis]|uniref:PucR family transcriptional regulator n=1 Tax=Bengtsoniella intestinalis TaxID=3073143 RepID=UPI00391F1797
MLELSLIIEKVERTIHTKLNLLAGENGLSNPISWAHIVETKESCPFLSGKELALITGAGLKPSFTLLQMIESLQQHHVSAVILFPGPYIEEIPQNVLAYCDAHNVPLFSLPWQLHMEDIIRVITYAIMRQEDTSQKVASAFYNAIVNPEEESAYLHTLTQNGFHKEDNYAICQVKFHSEYNLVATSQTLETMAGNLQGQMAQRGFGNLSIYVAGQKMLILLCNYPAEQLETFAKNLFLQVQSILKSATAFSLGVGQTIQGLNNISKSYQQATVAQRLQQDGQGRGFVFSYSEMGLHHLLSGIDNYDRQKEFYTNTLYPLEIYDRTNHGDLIPTLAAYFDHNGSVLQAAAQLHVHRNTVNQKLEKISALLEMPLSSWEVRAQLIVALKIKNLL